MIKLRINPYKLAYVIDAYSMSADDVILVSTDERADKDCEAYIGYDVRIDGKKIQPYLMLFADEVSMKSLEVTDED